MLLPYTKINQIEVTSYDADSYRQAVTYYSITS